MVAQGTVLTKIRQTVYVIVHAVMLNKKHYGSRTVKDVGLTVEGIIYGCYISRHITREATVVLLKLYATAPEIGSFSVSVLRIAL